VRVQLLGQKVAEWIRDHETAGFYSMRFDAKDLPSGVYVYQLSAGNEIRTRKLLLLK